MMPTIPWVMMNEERSLFLDTMVNLKLSSWYAWRFKKYIVKDKLGAMKSHDYHVLFQSILPCACGIKWLKNFKWPSCKYVGSLNIFVTRYMTQQYTKNWKVWPYIHYAYLEKKKIQVFLIKWHIWLFIWLMNWTCVAMCIPIGCIQLSGQWKT
jgi:hypothetical protein